MEQISTHRMTIRITPEDYKRIKDYSSKNLLSISGAIKSLIRNELK